MDGVRLAQAADLDGVARFWHESATAMEGGMPAIPSADALRGRIDDELRHGWELYVAEQSGVPIGMLAIKRHEAVLDQLFVATRHQSRGVGRALLRRAMEEMPAGFTLRMASGNERAARFYVANGLEHECDGLHPRTGAPVRYFRWRGSGARAALPPFPSRG